MSISHLVRIGGGAVLMHGAKYARKPSPDPYRGQKCIVAPVQFSLMFSYILFLMIGRCSLEQTRVSKNWLSSLDADLLVQTQASYETLHCYAAN
jgi:hypothetical protein